MNPQKILLFEDEYLLANDLSRQLQPYGFEVMAIFRKAEEGIKWLEEIQFPVRLPDLVLMDISLAGKMSGIEAARIILEKYNVALVFLTGMSQMDVFEEACRNKPHAFLIKPFVIQQALTGIRLALYQKQLENQLEELQKQLTDRG